ncbi:MAG: class I SAM-dependent methyltransferase, partial [Proteobacteria bacterium]|nr:class I SAM-dependent methyltransferase [Pseudomonadota bacterium]
NLNRCTNPDCGLVWIDPMPDAATLAKAYETYYTHTPNSGVSRLRRLYLRARNSYISRRFSYPATEGSWWVRVIGTLMALVPHRRIGMDAMAMWLPWHPEGTLLEIGCGNGDRLALLRDLGWTVSGIEPDAGAAQLASAKGLNVLSATLQPGALPAASFDAILMSHVIEHVPDPQETISECHRLLRPGGVLVMLTPNTESLGHRWFGRNWLHLDPPRHLYVFNSRNLPQLCADAGYTDVNCETTSRDAHWTLGASVVLQHNGHYDIGQLPLATRFLGLCLFYLEWIALFFQPTLGEEILVRATKR